MAFIEVWFGFGAYVSLTFVAWWRCRRASVVPTFVVGGAVVARDQFEFSPPGGSGRSLRHVLAMTHPGFVGSVLRARQKICIACVPGPLALLILFPSLYRFNWKDGPIYCRISLSREKEPGWSRVCTRQLEDVSIIL